MKSAKFWHGIEIAILLALTVAVVVFVLFKKTDLTEKFGLTASTTTELSTEVATTDSPETTMENTEAPTETTTPIVSIQYEEPEPSEIVPENFVDTVIIGNSQAQALSNFGLVKNADFVTRIGLSINRVLMTNAEKYPPIEDLYGKHYKKAVFVFGENELGWPYPKNFISEYKKVIEKVRELNPGIEIYCQAVFPVTAEHSKKNVNGVNNESVQLFNELIEEMCDEIGATYMPVSDAFKADKGALPADAAKDGVHFSYSYCKIWAGDMSEYLENND